MFSGKRAESLLTTNLVGDLRSPEKFGQRDKVLQQLNSKGASHSEPAKRVHSCFADPENFGQRAESLQQLTLKVTYGHRKSLDLSLIPHSL